MLNTTPLQSNSDVYSPLGFCYLFCWGVISSWELSSCPLGNIPPNGVKGWNYHPKSTWKVGFKSIRSQEGYDPLRTFLQAPPHPTRDLQLFISPQATPPKLPEASLPRTMTVEASWPRSERWVVQRWWRWCLASVVVQDPWDLEMGVSENRGIPKWMVYNGKPYKNGWFGGTTILGNIQMDFYMDGPEINERKWMGKNPTTYRSYRKFHPVFIRIVGAHLV